MLNTIFQLKNIIFLLLIVFFGTFILVNGIKKIRMTEGMTGDDSNVITGTTSSIAKVYNF
jgi:uncharacterized protein YycO